MTRGFQSKRGFDKGNWKNKDIFILLHWADANHYLLIVKTQEKSKLEMQTSV